MNSYPIKWACGNCHLEYVDRKRAEKCCTRGHENGWEV
jgi:hypothetical protein